MAVEKLMRFEELPDVLTPEECASYLGLNVRTVREYAREGKLRAARFGRYYRIKKQWLADFMVRASKWPNRI